MSAVWRCRWQTSASMRRRGREGRNPSLALTKSCLTSSSFSFSSLLFTFTSPRTPQNFSPTRAIQAALRFDHRVLRSGRLSRVMDSTRDSLTSDHRVLSSSTTPPSLPIAYIHPSHSPLPRSPPITPHLPWLLPLN